MFNILLFLSFSTILLQYYKYINIQQDQNDNTQSSSMRHKKGKAETSQITEHFFMESRFEIMERHVDHAHSNAISHEKLGLLKRSQTWVL